MRHENVINIAKINREAVNPYFIMEYFPAGSLRGRSASEGREIYRSPTPGRSSGPPRPASRTCTAPNYIHCDVKPDNFLVNALGELKIIDFAISKKIEKKGFLSGLFRKKTAKPAGTPSFMSPEQILNDPLDG